MSKTMLAGRMNFATKSFSVQEVPIPEPGRGEVRVKVRAAGVCLSDVHLIDGTVAPIFLPGDEVTLGHEVAGEVEALGEGVDGATVGDRVIVNAMKEVDGNVWTLGVDYDGGWAEYVVTPVESLIPMPDSLPFDQASIIPDAVSTPWGAISWTGKLQAGESAGVWGVGGLGVHTVQLLRFAGAAPIIAVDPSPAARDRALAAGADIALDSGDADFAAKMAEATGGKGLDIAFDMAGFEAVRGQAIASLGLAGRLVVTGITGGPLTVDNDSSFIFLRQQVLGHYGSEKRHVEQLVKLLDAGRLDFSGSISGTVPLAEAADAVKKLETKEGDPIRLVLTP